MADLGRFALLLALVASGWAVLAGWAGIRTGRDEATRSAEGALRAAALSLSVAGFALFYALLTRDFSLQYVAQYTNRNLSIFYTLGAFWAGHAGSLLLWAWGLAIYGVVVVRQNQARNRDLMPYVVPVLGVVLAFFTFLVAFTSNPFQELAVAPPDGQGLNPLLQNYGQWVHPVTLYLGFIGFTVPFAFAIAALATGQLGDRWIRTVRSWTLWSWLALTAGVMFGARWAYVELGWGGYWAWDPVENASLMPWLVGTAYLHSVMIQEKRGMLKVWNVCLIVATFALSIFGTFLTRSGVISSVHAFAQSVVGPFLILFVAAIVVGSASLIIWRLPELRSGGRRIESAVSRESSFLVNNLLLVAIAFAVFWGTVFPLVAEAVRGVKVSVGPPFFEGVVTPMAVLLLALVGICPLLAWRKASTKNLRRNFLGSLVSGGVAFVALTGLTRGRHLGSNVVLALGVFVMATIVLEFQRGLRVRRTTRGEGWTKAFGSLFARDARRYGGYLIHAGVVVLLTGIAINVSYKDEIRVSNLPVGEPRQIGGYTIALAGITTEETPAKSSIIGSFRVTDAGGKDLGTVVSEKSMYPNQEQPVTEVGIRSSWTEDLYIIIQSADPASRIASVAYVINPGLFWIWFGALVILAGGGITAWPRRTAKQPKEVPGETALVSAGGSR